MMHCTAENTASPWNDFKTDDTHWTVEFGSMSENRNLCINEEGFVKDRAQGRPWMKFIDEMVDAGAKKIWSDTATGINTHVTFRGGPDNTA